MILPFIFYGLLSAASILVAALSRCDRPRRIAFAGAIFAGWAATAVSFSQAHEAWIVLDTLLAGYAITSWASKPALWLKQLYFLWLAQLILHFAYTAALAVGGDIGYAYSIVLNVLFLCQLFVVSSMGEVINDIGGRLFAPGFRIGLYRIVHPY